MGKKKKHFSHPHRSGYEVLKEMNAIARESRMAERAPWTAIGMLCCYSMMRVFGWKQSRLTDLMNCINEYDAKWWNGEIELDDYKKRLKDKLDWDIEQAVYTEKDCFGKPGSYMYFFCKSRINPRNTILDQSTRMFVWFFNVLLDKGFGFKRLNVLTDFVNKEFATYSREEITYKTWADALMNEAGMVFEMPIDPLEQMKNEKHIAE